MDRRSHRASAWVAIALWAGCALRCDAAGDECDIACNSVKADMSSSEACAKARKSLPRPKIGRVCQEAFDEAWKLTCVEACHLHGTGRAPSNRLAEACDKRKREVPLPVAHRACVDGFEAGFAATTASISKRVESMNEGTKTALAENNAFLVKGAGTEDEALAEVDRSQAIEASQKEEEQDGSLTRIKDYPAEVDFQNEALAMKQEIEAALTVATAETTANTAEQEPQATTVATAGGMDAKYTKVPSAVAGEATSPILGGQGSSGDEGASNEPSRVMSEELGRGVTAGAEGFASAESHVDARYRDVLVAEHGQGVEPFTTDGKESVELSPVSGSEADDGLEAGLFTVLPDDERYREVLTMDHFKGIDFSAGQANDAHDHTRQKRHGDSPALDESDGDAVVAAAAGGVHKKETVGIIKLPDDPRYKETLTVDHIKGYRSRLPKKAGAREPQVDHIVTPEAVQRERDAVVKLPENGRYQEVLTVDHIRGFKNSPPEQEGTREADHDEVATEDAGIVDGVESAATIKLPDEPQYREVLTADHVRGFGAPFVEEDGTHEVQ